MVDHIDINKSGAVEVLIDSDGETVWINVNGVCRMRLYNIQDLEINDNREMNPPKLGKEL